MKTYINRLCDFYNEHSCNADKSALFDIISDMAGSMAGYSLTVTSSDFIQLVNNTDLGLS